MWTLLLRFWKPLACVAVLLLAWLALHHWGATRFSQGFSQGYQQAVSENAKALTDWKLKYDAQVKADEKRIANAHMAHEIELAQLAAARNKPLPRVVCHAESGSGSVPAATVIPGSADPAAGLLPPDPGVHPDITPALDLLVQRADKLSADARELNSAVHP